MTRLHAEQGKVLSDTSQERKMDKPKFDLSFRLNLGGYIWRRELRESATGEKYWHYYISNAKEPECDSQEN